MRRMLALVALAVGTSCASAPQEEAPVTARDTIAVTSTAFRDGEPLLAEFTCDGAGRIPPLTWHGVPPGTAALAVVVDDPDAPRGTFTHWVVLDLPPDTASLVDGRLPPGAFSTRNSAGRAGWYPPCPPGGTHHYRFTVHALARPTGLGAGAQLDAALDAVRAIETAYGRLVGVYSRKR